MHRLLFLLTFFPLLLPPGVGASDLAEFLEVYEARRALIDSRHARETQTIREMFGHSLEGLEETTAAEGNLDRILLLRAFRAELEEGRDPEPPPDLMASPAFQRLHETWLRLRREQQRLRDEQTLDLHENFDRALEQLQRHLTRDGHIGEASEVQATRKRFKEDPEHQAMRARQEESEAAREAERAHTPPPGQLMSQLVPATVLHLSFDRVDRMRNRTPDSSRSRNHGEVEGAEWVAQGRRGGAIRFGGRGARVVVNNDSSLQITGNQTIAFWIYPETFEARRNPLAKAFGGEGTITLEVDGTLNYYHGTAGRNARPYQGFRLERPIPRNAWTHLAVTRDFDAGKLVWYVNGEAVNEAETRFREARASRANLVLGRGYAGAFLGMLDEVMIFNQALSPEEIKALYHAVGGEP